ncbi:hypothetical protein BH23ACT9_BH23ACT9_00810 [soil metagenome]
MDTNERLGVAVVAAAVGAAVGAAVSRKGFTAPPVRRQPLQLLPVNDRPATGDVVPALEVTADAAPTVRSVPIPKLANAVSLMAIGALITMLVLWTTGTFAEEFDQTSASRLTTTLPQTQPVTAQDLPPLEEAPLPAADADVVEDGPADQATEPAPPPRADPVLIEIPAIGLSADVILLGLEDDGALEVPTDFAQTGWWSGGTHPGDVGPAVIAGHVDSRQGPAVFFDLEALAYDDLVRVTRADGSAATFAIRSSIAVEKDTFPTDLVYGSTDDSVLRLITCDGDFSGGSYLGNLIVTAELVREHPAPTSGAIF